MALKPCPSCGKSISSEASICPHCGYILDSNLSTFQKLSYPIIRFSALVLLLLNVFFMDYFRIYECFIGAITTENSYGVILGELWGQYFQHIQMIFFIILCLMFTLLIKNIVYKLIEFAILVILSFIIIRDDLFVPISMFDTDMMIIVGISRLLFWMVLAVYFHKRLPNISFILLVFGYTLTMIGIFDIIPVVGSLLRDIGFISILCITKKSWLTYFKY